MIKCPFVNVSRFLDVAWLPAFRMSTTTYLLTAVNEDGNLVVVETESSLTTTAPLSSKEAEGKKVISTLTPVSSMDSMKSEPREVLKNEKIIKNYIEILSGSQTVTSSLLLPKPLILLLRLFIQVHLN